MEIHVHQQSGVNILRLQGDLRRGKPTDDLKAVLDQFILDGNPKMVLNISDVNMIDSSGIGVIIRTHTTATEKGGGLKLVNPSKYALQTLKIVGLLNVLAIHDDEAAALVAFE